MNHALFWFALALLTATVFAVAQTERGRSLLHLIATGEIRP
jgi:hypothetical protein